MSKTISFHTSEGNDLKMTLYGEDLPQDAPCVIYVHGFKGFKDWGFIPPTGEMFASNGFRFLAMNFSHNGIGDDPLNFTELDKFRDNTFSLERSEGIQVIEAYQRGELFGDTTGAKTGLLGHSRGGWGAALIGHHCSGLSGVCLWAPVSDQRRYGQKTVDFWKEQGYLEIPNSRTGQVMQIGYQLHEDLMADSDTTLNIEAAASNMGKPLCIVHGADDLVVAVSDGKELAALAGDNCELHIVEGGDHVFGARHSWQGSTPQLEEAWHHTLSFFRKHLTH